MPKDEHAPPAYRKSTAREYFESICIAVILALFVRTFIVQAFKIPTGSMENNLLIGDHLLVNKFAYAPTMTRLEERLLPIDPIRRGDIIVFKYPEDPERDFIKRVIGLPGETISIRNNEVTVARGGERIKIDETYLKDQFWAETEVALGPGYQAGLSYLAVETRQDVLYPPLQRPVCLLILPGLRRVRQRYGHVLVFLLGMIPKG